MVAIPDRCWSVLSADRSAASIARALPSSLSRTEPAATASPSLGQPLDPNFPIHRAEEGNGDVQSGDDDRLAAIHLGGEAGVGVDRRLGRDVAALAEILGQHPAHEFANVEMRQVRQFSCRAVHRTSPCSRLSP